MHQIDAGDTAAGRQRGSGLMELTVWRRRGKWDYSLELGRAQLGVLAEHAQGPEVKECDEPGKKRSGREVGAAAGRRLVT